MSVTITRQPVDFTGYPGKKAGVSVGATGSGYLNFLSFYPWARVSGTGVVTYGSNYLGIFPDVELREDSTSIELGDGPCSISLKMSFGGDPQNGEYYWLKFSNGTENLLYLDASVFAGVWSIFINGKSVSSISYDGDEFTDLEISAVYDGSKITIDATDGITPKQSIGSPFTPAGDFPGNFELSYYTNVDVSMHSAKFFAPVMPQTELVHEWYRNGLLVAYDPDYEFTVESSDDGDTFYCIVSDVDGEVQSETVTMSITGALLNTSDSYAIANTDSIDLAFSLTNDYAMISWDSGITVVQSDYIPIANETNVDIFLSDYETIASDYELSIAATQKYGPSYLRTKLYPVFTPVLP